MKEPRACQDHGGQWVSLATQAAEDLRWVPSSTLEPPLPFTQGLPGAEGSPGAAGPAGPKGDKGQAGAEGLKGSVGPQGPKGDLGEVGCARRGAPGSKGAKGARGLPGYPGAQGDGGERGAPGDQGPRGLPGRRGDPGSRGEAGGPGSVGPPGEMGPKGSPGTAPSTVWDAGGGLVGDGGNSALRATTSPSCPLYPTELVLVLESSSTVSPALFSRMKELLALLLRDLQVSPAGCPAGARVAMVAYGASTTSLLRAGEVGSRAGLLARLRRLSPTRSARRGRLAAALSFVGQHTLKRVRPAVLGRKVVILVTSGQKQDLEGIEEVALQYEALGIVPAVLTFGPLPEVLKAFQVNNLFRVVQLPLAEPARDEEVLRESVLPCVLCFDLCHPGGCPTAAPDLLGLDLAFVVDNAAPAMPAARLEAVGQLCQHLLAQLAGPHPAQHSTRVALVLTAPSTPGQGLAEIPFGPPSSGRQLREQLLLALVPRVASAPLGGTVAWTLQHVFPRSSANRLRLLLVVGPGTTAPWDGEAQKALEAFSQCEDLGVLVVSLGRAGPERAEVAVPRVLPAWRYHALRLGTVHPPELGYVERAALGFLRRLQAHSSQRPPAPGCPQELLPTSTGTGGTSPGTPGR
ncbi:collagen alpha-4(VI) chain-like [Dryobates pubescens]|uniref:collagen alpha-4(VI) chain-like n=1 Tax=Dryobates pubescens TaxID=118200 RepID=UPI0023B91C9C|nr:collagen alpha-4(VI) chain-like [Dryobates pubescens]